MTLRGVKYLQLVILRVGKIVKDASCRHEALLKEKRRRYLEIRSLLDGQVLRQKQSREEEAAQRMTETRQLHKQWEADKAAEEAAARDEAIRQQLSFADAQNQTR